MLYSPKCSMARRGPPRNHEDELPPRLFSNQYHCSTTSSRSSTATICRDHLHRFSVLLCQSHDTLVSCRRSLETSYSATVRKTTTGRWSWIRKRTRREEKRLSRRCSSGRRRRGKGRSNGSKRRSASRSGRRSGRNASGSVRKHEVSRRAPHEQDGPGFLAASALLLAFIHPSAWKGNS